MHNMDPIPLRRVHINAVRFFERPPSFCNEPVDCVVEVVVGCAPAFGSGVVGWMVVQCGWLVAVIKDVVEVGLWLLPRPSEYAPSDVASNTP